MANTATVGTITKVDQWTYGNRRTRIVDVQINPSGGSDNYLAGGKTITPRAVGLYGKISAAIVVTNPTNGTLSYRADFDHTNQKLKIWGTNAAPGAAVGDPELTAGTDLNTYTARMKFEGY